MADSPPSEQGFLRVAYQGEPGAYSEKATISLLGEGVRCFGQRSFEDVFKAVQSGFCDYGSIPIENSLGGSIHANYDLLLRFNLHIVAELEFRVEHCLMVLPDVKREDVKRVISHPQALAQCDGFIRKWGVEPHPSYDTAGSAKLIADQGLRDTAAIASELAARTYGLKVLATNIEDDEFNYTRFLLIGREPLEPPADAETKTSIVFSLQNASGSLFRAQACFVLRDIDLSKIESRPAKPEMYVDSRPPTTTVPGVATTTSTGTGTGTGTTSSSSSVVVAAAAAASSPTSRSTAATTAAAGGGGGSSSSSTRSQFQYLFYLDVLAGAASANCVNALNHLREQARFVRVLGSFATRGTLPEVLRARVSASAATARSQAAAAAAEGGEGEAKLTIGIVGFGNFGQFLAKTFARHANVVATSRSDYTALAETMNVSFVPGLNWERFFSPTATEACRPPDVVLVATSILSFEETLRRIPQQLLAGRLLVDVLSVKEHPKKVMLELLPSSCDVLCTHPMFGPESGKHGWSGLPFVYDRVRVQDSLRCARFLSIWDEEGCAMRCMSCEEHDRHAAGSQFITHLTGRMLAEQRLEETPIDTQGFISVRQLVANTCQDSFDLFFGLFHFNSNSAEQVARLERSLAEVKGALRRAELQLVRDTAAATNAAAAGAGAGGAASGGAAGGVDGAGGGDCDYSLSALAEAVKPSKTVMMHALTQELKAQGRSVLSLCVGEPDFPPEPEVLAALAQAADANDPKTRYTAVAGTVELRTAVAAHLQQRKGMSVAPSQVLLSNGAKQCIYQALMAVVGPGDEVIIPTPCWTSYPEMVGLCGATPRLLPCTPASGYTLHAHQLAAALTPRTRLLILCNPCNPTGAVIGREGLEAIAEVVAAHPRLLVLSDEIYERIVYDTPHVSFSSLSTAMAERTLTVNGFSKAYAMTGLRLGYMVGPTPLIAAATVLQSQITSCASAAAQHAALAALQLPQTRIDAMVTVFREKRDFALSRLAAIPGVTCPRPEGAFYLMPDLSSFVGTTATWKKSQPPPQQQGGGGATTTPSSVVTTTTIESVDDICVFLLQEFGVALVPGSAFSAPETLRISYATDMSTLGAALDGLRDCLASLTRTCE